MKSINMVYEKCGAKLLEEVNQIIRKLSPEDVTKTKELKKLMETLGAEYDNKLIDILSSRKNLKSGRENNIMETRSKYEIARFDLVSKINENDRNKKLILTQVACDVFYMFRNVFSEGFSLVQAQEPYFNNIQQRTVEVEQSMPQLNQAWSHVRIRLEGELIG